MGAVVRDRLNIYRSSVVKFNASAIRHPSKRAGLFEKVCVLIIQEWRCANVRLRPKMVNLEFGSAQYSFTLVSPGNDAIEVWLDKSAESTDETVAIILDNCTLRASDVIYV